MKNFTILFCLLAAFFRSNAQEGWSQPDPNIEDARIDDVYFINPDTGWLAGTSIIRKTTDGGQTWATQLTTPNNYLRSIEFLDDQTGFCGTLDGEFFRTTDGGQTWVDISDNVPGSIPGICGIAHHGQNVYACGIWSFPAYFIKSYDAGDTWTYKNMSEHAIALIDPVFFTPDSGFVAGQDADGGNILFTADGGETWEEVHNTGVPGEYVWKLQMLNRDTLFASVENFGPSGSILTSHDGGKTWMSIPFPFWGDIQAIGFVSGTKGWVGGYFPGFHETNDGGETWQQLPIGSTLNRIFVLSPQLAYASGVSFYKYTGPEPPSATVTPKPKPDLDWKVTASNGGKDLQIQLDLHRTNNVNIGLYSMEGRLIQNLYNGRLPSGTHSIDKALQGLTTGTYLVGLQINEGMSARKISVHLN